MAEPAGSAVQSGVTRAMPSHKTWTEADGDEEEVQYEDAEDGPIFSLSKSSMDVLMATEPIHPWDPAVTRQDLRRSSSTNTHTERQTCSLQQLRERQLTEDAAAAANKALPIPRPLSERWSTCSTRSDCSTPDSVIWRGGPGRPKSLIQVAPSSKLAHPASPSPPFDSPETPPVSPSTRPPLPLSPCGKQPPMSSPTPASPTPEVPASPPIPPSAPPPTSPEPRRLPSMEYEHIPSACGSPSSPTSPPHRPVGPGSDGGVGAGSHRGAHPVQASEELPSVFGSARSVVGGEEEHLPPTQTEGREPPRQGGSPWQPGSSAADLGVSRRWRSPLASSLSDTGLSARCRCSCGQSRLETPGPPGGKDHGRDEVQEEQETPGSPVRSVDAAVQTASPPGSWSGLRKHTSFASASHMGSHSVLGSPPGSRLNLRSPVGSTSNLVSATSSMFFQDAGEEREEEKGEEEEEKSKKSSLMWETLAPAAAEPPERRRSCLKVQGEERPRGRGGELGRRGSMKQVQWDEEGMTWDVYGSSVDPEELNVAIERHLTLRGDKDKQGQSPPPPRSKWRLKAATRVAGTTLSQTRAAEVTVLGSKEPPRLATPTVDPEGEAKAESELEKGKRKKQELAADVGGKRKIEVKREKGNGKGEEKETPEHRSSPCMSLSLTKGLKWPRVKPCCGGSSQDHN
ncbi:arginine-glutamic acid dipeptide repeats protein-like [Gadus macrocephalus]|uniref:arginine-glutamic acid dipeptide repeats protein-like n=1 Tax=Gadus macrocephalus TaxID=80720 RepID=UPI0028CB4FB7|nr:arginine-glutamic acid dipeptide repeats protein-like [Gadus macrocephalus]